VIGIERLRAAHASRRAEPAPLTWYALAPTIALAATGTVAVIVVAMCLGTTRISPATTLGVLGDHLLGVSAGSHSASADAIVWEIRAPRVLLAALVGATLAFAGAAYQAIFRNPLAEPYIMGVAAGASVGATLVIVSPLAITAGVLSPLPPAAFAGALIAVSLAYGLARVGATVPSASLILSGVAVSSVGTSLVTYLMLAYNTRTLAILNWILGSFNTASWTKVAIASPYALVAFAVILPFGRVLNVLQLDEPEARHLGVDVDRVRLIVLVAASLATAAAVAVSGLIGFVGLIVPHAVRLVWGPDYRRVLPLSAFCGASFLVLMDLIARSADATFELPIGVVTALIGAPCFLLLLRRQGRAIEVRP
jgi:iron complex transport system permease protein